MIEIVQTKVEICICKHSAKWLSVLVNLVCIIARVSPRTSLCAVGSRQCRDVSPTEICVPRDTNSVAN
jgi:hypothetical protein